jgi:hypothetical protein
LREPALDNQQVPAVITALFDAMNRHDADAAAAAVDADIEIEFGRHRVFGVEAIREFAMQDEPALHIVNTAVSCEQQDGRLNVLVRRVSHWRESGELSSEEEISMSFELTPAGLVGWARIG